MKLLTQILVIAVLGWLLTLFFPWWSIAIAGFTGGYAVKSKYNFSAGFIAIAGLWFCHAFIIDWNASAPLAQKVAALLMVKNKTLLFGMTSVIGGLVGGFSSLTGSLLRSDKGGRTKSGHYRNHAE